MENREHPKAPIEESMRALKELVEEEFAGLFAYPYWKNDSKDNDHIVASVAHGTTG